MLTANSQLKALKKLINTKHRVTIKDALKELETRNNKLFNKRCETNTNNLLRELLMCDIRRCNKLLEGLWMYGELLNRHNEETLNDVIYARTGYINIEQIEGEWIVRVEQIKVNQIKVYHEEVIYFFSYETLIAVQDTEYNMYLTSSWDYSNTTLKYLRIAFPSLSQYSKKDIAKKLQDGEISHYKEYIKWLRNI